MLVLRINPDFTSLYARLTAKRTLWWGGVKIRNFYLRAALMLGNVIKDRHLAEMPYIVFSQRI